MLRCGMEIRLVGELTNVKEAVREVRHIYSEAPEPSVEDGAITDSMCAFMVELLRRGNSRALFLWLLKVTLDITAPEHWWHQADSYFTEVQWVRRHPSEQGERANLSQDDFEGGIPTRLLDTLNENIAAEQRKLLAATLPENFIRRAYAQSDYGALRRLYLERGHYNSGHWRDLAEFLSTLPYGEFITTRS